MLRGVPLRLLKRINNTRSEEEEGEEEKAVVVGVIDLIRH